MVDVSELAASTHKYIMINYVRNSTLLNNKTANGVLQDVGHRIYSFMAQT
jgi:hypothetical protein